MLRNEVTQMLGAAQQETAVGDLAATMHAACVELSERVGLYMQMERWERVQSCARAASFAEALELGVQDMRHALLAAAAIVDAEPEYAEEIMYMMTRAFGGAEVSR